MTTVSPTVARRRLARALRRLRANADLTIEQVAEKVDLSASTISRLETAQASVRRGDIRELLDIYEVTGSQRDELLQLAGQSRRRPWWEEFKDLPNVATVDLEAEATVIRQYSPLLVPGILQTEAYAREVLSKIRSNEGPEGHERSVRFRMDRQRVLNEPRSALREIVLDEAAVRRLVGGHEVMHAQLQRLIDASDPPKVSLQLLPFSTGAHAAMDGEFTIFSFQDLKGTERVFDDPDVVYLESRSGGRYLEDPNITEGYSRLFDDLSAAALDVANSIQMLAVIQRELP